MVHLSSIVESVAVFDFELKEKVETGLKDLDKVQIFFNTKPTQ